MSGCLFRAEKRWNESQNETAASEQGQKSARKAIWRAGPLNNRYSYFLSTWVFHLDPFGTVDGRISAPVDIMVALSQVVAPWDFFHLFGSIGLLLPHPFECQAGGFFPCTKRGDAEVSIVSKIGLTMWRPNLPAIDVAECCWMWLIWIVKSLVCEDFP